jgi:hydrogenase maturation protease
LPFLEQPWHGKSISAGDLETDERMIYGIGGVHVKALVVGIGNDLRGDDDAGLAVARLIKSEQPASVTIVELNNDVTSLLDHLPGFDVAMIIDATQSGSLPGTIHRFDASTVPLPDTRLTRSTHGMTVGSILELARIQQLLPKKVLIYGIEGKQFNHGSSMTPEVERAVRIVAQMIYTDLGAEARLGHPEHSVADR